MDVTRALDHLGVTLTNEQLAGSRSGSQVCLGDRHGTEVIVKITSVDSELDHCRAARELTFYDQLAQHCPIATPRLLDALSTDQLTVLVLQKLEPTSPAHTWDDQRWLAAVDLLVALHSGPRPSGHGWKLPPPTLLDPDDPAVLSFLSDPDDQTLLTSALAVADQVTAVEPTFVHGDFHAANLLLDHDGRLALTDWQECGIGDPSADLAFLLTRAVPLGAAPPVNAMGQRYAQTRGLDADAVSRAVAAHQVRAIALQYPTYLPFLDDAAVTRLRDGFRAVATQLCGQPSGESSHGS